MKINKTHTHTRGQQRNVVKYLHFGGCSTAALCASLLPLACCQLPQSVACSINKMSELHCERKRERRRERGRTEWRSDWRSESIGCPISRHDWYMACIDMDTVLDFHFVGLSAQCKRTSHRQHSTSIQHPFSIHPTSCVNVSVSQSVSQCLHKSVSDLCVCFSLIAPRFT